MFGSLPWDEAMTKWAYSYRAAFAAHPNTIQVLSTTTVAAPGALRKYELVIAGLTRAGWQPAEAITVMMAVEAFVLGCALDLVAPEQMIDTTAAASEVPVLAAALRAAARSQGRSDEVFADGLEAIIQGLRLRLAKPRRPRRNSHADRP